MSDPDADALRALLAEGLVELNRRSADLPLLLARHAARVPAEVLASTYGYLAVVQRLHALVIRAFVPLGAEHGTAGAFMAAADELTRASQRADESASLFDSESDALFAASSRKH
jgi:hypothetical protein